MSDDARDKPQRDVSRGPLPRTNRPRPDQSRKVPKRESTASRPDTAPPQSAVIAVEPGDSATLAERPTQLDTNPRDDAPLTPHRSATRPAITGLKRVGLSKTDARDTDKMEEPGPAGSYVGYVIDGRYRIEKIIGRGGMGVVYRAKHTVIDKLAAIKILLPTEDPDVVERFVNEAKAATSIGNDHIVDTVDFGELPDGSTFFVMEYLEGQTLAKLIKQEKFIPLSRAIDFAHQIAEGVGAAHLAGIVHRDLKPENIFLAGRDGEEFVKLLDFGIAKMQHAQNRITRAGTIFGTPHYMSPEQAAGAEVDPRTDIYSLGIILYEMLSGSVPFDAENPMGLLTQHMYTEPVPLTRVEEPPQEVPLGVDAIVLKCLAKKPHGRYASMAEFVLDLSRFERGEPPVALADLLANAEKREDEALAARARDGLRSRRPPRPTRWLGVAFVLAVIAFGGSFFFGMRRRAPAPLHRAETVPVAAPQRTNAPSPNEPARRPVALVFSPIDGEVFREGKSLGGMPVTVSVGPSERFEVEIRREGFHPKKVDIDGTRPVIVVQLTPISGVVPVVPVPSVSALDALRRKSDGGARLLAALLHDRPGLLSHRRDAGAGAASSAPPAPPAGAPAAAPAPVSPPAPPPQPPVMESPPAPLQPPPAPSTN
jgi:eukaryotic-like serine/threonine-protein kinase